MMMPVMMMPVMAAMMGSLVVTGMAIVKCMHVVMTAAQRPQHRQTPEQHDDLFNHGGLILF
jgi:hypothetical protein